MNGKVVLVTGSSRGIGAELVINLARTGARLVINYSKSEELADEVLQKVHEYTKEAVAIKADVANRREVQKMFDKIFDNFGRLDVLINNAGVNIDKPFLQIRDDDWKKVLDTNLTGTFICSQEFAKRYNGEDGHIVNIAAATGIFGRKNGANYCSAKAGVITLTKCLAMELAPKIKVNCVLPGVLNTEEVIERYQLDDQENYEKNGKYYSHEAFGNAKCNFQNGELHHK